MFSNPGSKIKSFGVFLFWLSTIGFVGFGLIYSFFTQNPLFFVLYGVAAPIGAYISCLYLVGFGELVQNSTEIKEHLIDDDDSQEDVPPARRKPIVKNIEEIPYSGKN